MASSHTKLDRRDIPWLALIAASFAGGLAFSWQRWGNPLVDCGREMNQPLRLIHGEMLYSSIRHIYGPLSPYINATLYRVFGASLGTLYADGIISALVIVLLVYWLSRHLMGRLGAAAASLSVTWLCTFKQAGNYILPYAYSALHGCLLGLITLALLVRFAELRKKRYLFAAGVAAGITILAKTEMGAAACITGIAATLLVAFPSFGKTVSLGTLFVVPAGAIPLAVYGWIARIVGVTTLSHDSFLLPSYIPEEFIYFNKRMSG
ncbi:MAG TPA: glycosyltransferase family 39 protein, partial [Blastocatellia bacterium]|nr:glycosyltransferase family 39 protein [Blastocatellia bacterium]